MKNSKLDILLLTVLSSFLFFWKLGEGSLAGADEAIYGQMAKEVLRFGDWFTMHFNGAPRFVKPPLYVWLTTLNYKLFGINEFATRFWSACFGAGGIVALYFLGRILFEKRTALLSSFILLASAGYFAIGRQAMLETTLTFFIILTIFFFWRSRGEPRYLIPCGGFLGLALMTKSAIGLFPLAIIGFFLVFTGNLKSILQERSFYWGCLAFLLVGGPWHIAHLIVDKRQFFDSYVLHTLVEGLGSESRFQGLYFYPLFLFIYFFPWIILLPSALAFSFRLIKNIGNAREKEVQFFLLCWIIFPFLVFLFGREKLEWYLVLIYPALALLLGNYIFRKRDTSRVLRIFPPASIIILLVIAFLSIYPFRVYDFDPYNKSLGRKMKAISEPEDKVVFYDSRSISFIFYSDRFAAPVLKKEKELIRRLNSGEKGFFCIPEKDFQKLGGRIKNPDLTFFYPEGGTSLFTRKVDKRVLVVKK